jgi:hypothetical protein
VCHSEKFTSSSTAGESWMFHNYLATKQQSSQWRTTGSLMPRKGRNVEKMVMTDFFNQLHTLYQHAVP